MEKIEKTRAVGGLKGTIDSFISRATEKGLELAEGSKFVQQNLPETHKAITSAKKMYAGYNKIASGKTRDVGGKAAEALSMVVKGFVKDAKRKTAGLFSKINPFKKKETKAPVMATVSKTR